MDSVTAHDAKGSVLFKHHSSSSKAPKEIIGYIDTGTSLIIGPKKEIAAFAKNAGARTIPFVGGYVIKSCDPKNVPSLSFTIQGKDYVIPGSLLVMVRSMHILITVCFSWGCYLFTRLSHSPYAFIFYVFFMI